MCHSDSCSRCRPQRPSIADSQPTSFWDDRRDAPPFFGRGVKTLPLTLLRTGLAFHLSPCTTQTPRCTHNHSLRYHWPPTCTFQADVWSYNPLTSSGSYDPPRTRSTPGPCGTDSDRHRVVLTTLTSALKHPSPELQWGPLQGARPVARSSHLGEHGADVLRVQRPRALAQHVRDLTPRPGPLHSHAALLPLRQLLLRHVDPLPAERLLTRGPPPPPPPQACRHPRAEASCWRCARR